VSSTIAWADFASGQAAFDAGDYASAYRDWQSAADRGDPQAQLRLGDLYEKGLGVPQHFIRAHLYYNLAGVAGLEAARVARDTLGERMSPEMVAEAQALAAEWRPSGEPPASAGGTASAEAGAEQGASITWGADSGALLAVLGDESEKLREILAGGGNPNQRSADGDTLLMQAVRNSDIGVVRALLDAGANPNLKGQGNWTPLKAAIYAGRADVARLLLARGADANDPAPDGLTALALAQRLGHADLVTVLSR
jgi:hypothetical protein